MIAVFAAIILVSNYFLFVSSKSELAPTEDPGFIMALYTAAPNASLDQTMLFSKQVRETTLALPEVGHTFQVDGMMGLNSGFEGMVLKPWEQRKRLAHQVQADAQGRLARIAGVNAVAFLPPPLPGGGEGMPVQFVLGTTDPSERLNDVAQSFMQKAYASGLFVFLDTDLKIDKPQTTIEIDRDKTAQLGLTMSDIGSSLGSMLGGASLNIYTEVGLVTLIGLIYKHGILIVQFANELQRAGKGKREAVEMASAIRLRPILMTTAAMVLGVLPLVTASGAGAAGRFNMGLVIMSGISIGTMFTLFVVPAMYMFLAAEHEKDRAQL